MLKALIAGERDPKVLVGLAQGRMRVKHAALVQALTGRFDDHHAELARMLLDQIDALTAQVSRLTARIEELITAIPAPREWAPTALPGPAPAQAWPCCRPSPGWMRSPGSARPARRSSSPKSAWT
jgi:transposase